MNNLAGSPEHTDLQMELESRLQNRLAELGDEFLDGRTYLERDGLGHYREVNNPYGQKWKDPWKNR